MARWRLAMLLVQAVVLLAAAGWRAGALSVTVTDTECIQPRVRALRGRQCVRVFRRLQWYLLELRPTRHLPHCNFTKRSKMLDEKYPVSLQRIEFTLGHNLEEEAMKKRFEEWMVGHHRTYKDEEKAQCYKLFKNCANRVDKLNALANGVTYKTNDFCDHSEEEMRPYHTGG
ncbi:hypothetical protein ACQ4PT_034979 [Festuca glaucescens]